MFFNLGLLKYFTIFTGKHLYWSRFFNKVAGIEKKTPTQVFFYKYCKIFKNSFLIVVASAFNQFHVNVPFSWGKKMEDWLKMA